MKEILFSGKDVEVRFNGNIKNKKNIIIFREGGGLPVILKDGTIILDQFFPIINFEGLFASDDINEFYIEAFNFHLYTSPEMEKAIESIKNILLPDAVNVTFGLSMGATGAVNFSKDLNATFVAFGPRATASGLLPLSNKAGIYANSYKLPPSNVEQGICKECEGYVFFDYYNNIDRIHALYIKHHTKSKILNHPFWGHVNIYKVTQLMSLKNIIYNILNQNFDLKILKKRMYNNYFKDSYYKYINFIVDKYFKKERRQSLKEFLSNKIDVNNIKHIQYIAEYLLKINKNDIAFSFVKEAYILNNNNLKTRHLLVECLSKLPDQLNNIEFAFLKEEISAYIAYIKGDISHALNTFNNSHNKNFYSPSSYVVYATCLEFSRKENEALEIIENGITQYPNNEDIKRYKDCLNVRILLAKTSSEDMLGAFTFIAGHLYKIVKGNYKATCDYYSLFNCETKMYLRHYNGKLIESEKKLNPIFLFDSSFIIYSNNNKILFRCSNLNLTNLFIAKKGDKMCKIHYFDNIKLVEHFSFDIFYQRK